MLYFILSLENNIAFATSMDGKNFCISFYAFATKTIGFVFTFLNTSICTKLQEEILPFFDNRFAIQICYPSLGHFWTPKYVQNNKEIWSFLDKRFVSRNNFVD